MGLCHQQDFLTTEGARLAKLVLDPGQTLHRAFLCLMHIALLTLRSVAESGCLSSPSSALAGDRMRGWSSKTGRCLPAGAAPEP